jgi:predicted XRE-type DNA-binding protein
MADTKLSAADLERARTDTRLAVIGEVTNLFERLYASGEINQSRMAERLGVTRQAVSKLLSGPAQKNWTIDTLSELLAAMHARVSRIEMAPLDELPAANEIHPWLEGVLHPVLLEAFAVVPGNGVRQKVHLPNTTAHSVTAETTVPSVRPILSVKKPSVARELTPLTSG